jgi:5,10-methylenetetrahydrofolate reductase
MVALKHLAKASSRQGALGYFELIAELPPKRSFNKIVSIASRLIELADSLDVPDAPLGYPSPSSPVVSAALKASMRNDVDIIAHLRLLDTAHLGAVNVAMAMESLGISRLLLLRGDRPSIGSPCSATPEDVAATIRGLGLKVKVGHLLSLAKPVQQVLQRVSSGADFYVVTRPWRSPLIGDVSRAAHQRNAKVYVYLVVLSKANAELLSSIPREELVMPDEVKEAVSALRERVDGVIISSPRDLESQLRALREARSAL